ncbi:MAG: UDP-3-O-acyl-N-acetylglucosamine deacetylase [Myxococcota bacterium]
MSFQHTLRSTVGCTGIGLHSGKRITLTLRPAHADTGIVFVRTDLGGIRIPATPQNVIDTSLATTLGKNGASVSTVEHVLAALSGLGVDNALVELDGEEVPIMDGSSAPFVVLIRVAGVRSQRRNRRILRVERTVQVKNGDKVAELRPSDDFRLSYTIDFDHPSITTQFLDYAHSERAFARDLSRARTFGFLEEVEMLQEKGLARGGSLDNAVVVGEDAVLNREGLRYEDEFVRHKVLDAIGDLSLVGCAIQGHFLARKAGHALNHALLTELLSDSANYTITEEAPVPGLPASPPFAVLENAVA